jgi:hypothetical protein
MKNDTLNKKMWPIHKMCFDCVIKKEDELKRTGKFEEYQRNMMMGGVKTHIKEMEDVLLEVMLGDGKETFVTEAGDIEEWRGGNIDKKQIISINEFATEENIKYIIKFIQEGKDVAYISDAGTPGVSGGNGTGTGNPANPNASAGVTNTGGGGGGGSYNYNQAGAAGGSGTVIISVATSNYPGTYTGTATTGTNGSNTWIRWTGSGTYTA